MKNLPKRGPVVLWTGPNQERLMAEIFPYQDGFVVVRAHWPEAFGTHPATFVPAGILRNEYKGRGPYYSWELEEDDKPALQEEWAAWLKVRDKPGHTREDARKMAEASLDIKIEVTP